MAARTSSRIIIDAPRADVMAVIADFAAYPQWASAVRAAETLVRDTYVLGYEWDGDAGVRWQMAEPGSMISGMSGGYALADRAGATEATYDLAVDLRVPMPGLLKRRAEKTIIDTALNGLKKRAERLSAEPGSSASARREAGDTGGDGR